MDSIWIQNINFFFIGTISLAFTQYIDRFFIQHFKGDASVGIYTFYTSIANIVQVFLVTGLTTILYPKIVMAYQQGHLDEYKKLMRKLFIGIIAGGGCLVILGIIGVKIMLTMVNKPLYEQEMPVFFFLVAAVYIGAITWVPRCALYVRNFDKQIVVGALIVVPISGIGNFMLVPECGIMGSAAVVLLSNVVWLIVNMYYLHKYLAIQHY